MMSLVKVVWVLRALVYKLRFKSVGMVSYIGKPVFMSGTKRVTIGNRVRIYPGIRMETIQGGEIVIRDNVSIGQNFHVIAEKEELVIGENTTISANVYLSNTEHEYTKLGVHVLDQDRTVRHTFVGRNCFLGFGCVILPGTILGNQCIVGANAVVKGEFESYSVIAGNPARLVKKYDSNTDKWEKVK